MSTKRNGSKPFSIVSANYHPKSTAAIATASGAGQLAYAWVSLLGGGLVASDCQSAGIYANYCSESQLANNNPSGVLAFDVSALERDAAGRRAG